jgi:hypothetical protein
MIHVDKQILRAESALATVTRQNASRPCKHFERVIAYWTNRLQKLKDANNDNLYR